VDEHVDVDDADALNDRSVMGRGLKILEALSRAGRALTAAELVRATRLPKSTVHRLLGQFVELGLIDRTGDGFGLGLRMFEWGSHAERQRRLRAAAIPFLSDIHQRTGETLHLAVLDGRDVLYIEKIEGSRAVRCPTYVGGRMPAHATALGKAMLAFSPAETVRSTLSGPLPVSTPRTVHMPGLLSRQLTSVRERRVSIEVEESFLGVACVAVPMIDEAGLVLGAISMVTPTQRFDSARSAPILLHAADQIARKLNTGSGSAF
jgi:IclR family transcriptional regulator, acetate operon repressor